MPKLLKLLLSGEAKENAKKQLVLASSLVTDL